MIVLDVLNLGLRVIKWLSNASEGEGMEIRSSPYSQVSYAPPDKSFVAILDPIAEPRMWTWMEQ